MSYTVKVYNPKTDAKYLPEMKALADWGLSPGFFNDEVVKNIESNEYFCSIALDDDDKVCCVSYGYLLDLNGAANELRCSANEVASYFPGVTKFASHVGMATRPDMQGQGIAKEMVKLHKKLAFPYADIIFNIVWNRKGAEKSIVAVIKHFGAEFLKTIPLYWYDEPDLYCTVCKGRCVCDCDIYYYTKDGFKL